MMTRTTAIAIAIGGGGGIGATTTTNTATAEITIVGENSIIVDEMATRTGMTSGRIEVGGLTKQFDYFKFRVTRMVVEKVMLT